LVILAMLAAGGSVTSLVERLQYGRGLLFMDVELFAMIAVGLGGLGVFLLWLGSRLSHKRFSPPPSG
jgi:cell division protein FtsX